MSTFAFKALDLTGTATRGEVEADDKQSVASQLRAKGLIVLDIEEQKPTDVGDLFARFKRVKAQELTVATRQLSTMISSGMSLLRALYVLEDQAENDKLRDTIADLKVKGDPGLAIQPYDTYGFDKTGLMVNQVDRVVATQLQHGKFVTIWPPAVATAKLDTATLK